MEEKRFEPFSETHSDKLKENASNKNTKRSTNTWVNVYRSWAAVQGRILNLEEYSPDELGEVLCQFYGEICKKDGTDYEPDCLRVMQAALNRYLLDKNYPISILNGTEFSLCNKVLERRTRELLQRGHGKRPKTAQALTMREEERLWVLGKLGNKTPITLLHTLWFNNAQYFGQRGRQDHIAMTVENFRREFDEHSGKSYIEFVENPLNFQRHDLDQNHRDKCRKMFETGGRRCPVALFDLYMSKRPFELRNTGRFYLSPKLKYEDGGQWYKTIPIGKNRIGLFTREILSGTEFENCGKKLNIPINRKILIKEEPDDPESSIIASQNPREVLYNYHPGDESEFRKTSGVIMR